MSIHFLLLNCTVNELLEAPSTRSFSKMIISISQNLVMKSQVKSALGKTHATPQEPQYAYSYKSTISFTLIKEEYPPLLYAYSPLRSFTDSAKSSVHIRKNS